MTHEEALAAHPKLIGVHPVLVRKGALVLQAMALLGFPMRVVQGVRTTEQQQALYAQGRTKPGAIVTNADGVRTRSNHQPRVDGFGHAIDCAFVNVNGTPDSSDDRVDWSDDLPWGTYGRCATAVGLRWGGDWKSIVDRPHVELPRAI